MKKQNKARDMGLIVFLSLLCVAYIYPIFMILMNSLKDERAITTSTAFLLPRRTPSPASPTL